MKTEFLKSLGIVDQSVIDAIFAENGKDVNAVKVDTSKYDAQIEDLKNQIKERDTQLSDLKKSVKDNDALTAKITELESVNEKTKTDYETKISEMSKHSAIDNALRDARAKNVKAVKALLDTAKIELKDDKLVGFDEQLKTLTESDNTKFLFGEDTQKPPTGTNPASPPASGDPTPKLTFAEAIAKSMNLKG